MSLVERDDGKKESHSRPFKDDEVIITGLPEDGGPNSWAGFSDKAIRQAFIRKVYAILMLQLTFTFAITALFVFENHVRVFVRQNFYMYYAAYVIFIVVYITLICSRDLRRSWPANMILLVIFTGAMSFMVATIAVFHAKEVVLLAAGLTAACCLAITLFSFHSKFDFTSCAGFLFISIWILLLFGILTIFMRTQIMLVVYSACGALLFMLFLAYDTQLVVGGKKYSISPEEHVFAAMQLYLDVVYIFLYLMSLISGARR